MPNKQILIGVIIILLIIFVILNTKSENINTNSIQNTGTNTNSIQNTGTTAIFNNVSILGRARIQNATIRNFTGIIVMWSGSNIPVGWALCDGTNGTPDLRGRFILGSGKGVNLTNRTIGDMGGSENHSLTIEEMPPHLHEIVTSCAGNNCNSVSGLRANLNNNYLNNYNILDNVDGNQNRQWPKVVINTNLRDNGFAKRFFTDTTGGDSAKFTTDTRQGFSNLNWSSSDSNTWIAKPHNNMPPYYVLAYIMKL